MSAPGPVMIMAGGTGGHVFPALAVAEALRARDVPVVWVGTAQGLEARVVPEHGITLEQLRIVGLRGRGPGAMLLFPLRLARALLQAWRIVGRWQPRVALGMGGFVAGPGGLVAWLRRVPLVVHEQNAVPGLTNRILARFARRTLEAVPGSFPAARRATHTGNPVRPEISALPPPEARMRARRGAVRLLVFGGSRGAAALNALVPAACAALEAVERPEVWHQVGTAADQGQVRADYAGRGLRARIEPFIADMAEAYGWADLVLCRAGAITIAELANAGVASILVPYPHAVDDHQTRNAAFLVAARAAELVPQAQLSAARLAALLRGLGRERLLAMAAAARALATPHATIRVTEACLEVAR